MKYYFLSLSLCGLMFSSLPTTIIQAQQVDTQTQAVVSLNNALVRELNQKLKNPETDKLALYKEWMYKAKTQRSGFYAQGAGSIAYSAKQHDLELEANALWRELEPRSELAYEDYMLILLAKRDPKIISHFLQNDLTQAQMPVGSFILKLQKTLSLYPDKKTTYKWLSDVLKPLPHSFEKSLALSQSALDADDKKIAIDESNAAYQLNNTHPEALLSMLNVRARYMGALPVKEILLDFIQRNPSNIEGKRILAEQYFSEGNVKQAQKELEHILQEEKARKLPTHFTLEYLAMIESRQDNPSQAKVYLQNILEQNPSQNRLTNRAYIGLANLALQNKNYAEAEQILSKIEPELTSTRNILNEINPIWLEIQMRRARLLAEQHKFVEARQFLQKFQPDNDDDFALIIKTEAQILSLAGMKAEAFTLLRGALFEHFHASYLYDLSLLSEDQNQPELAESLLRHLVGLEPNNADYLNALAYSFAQRNINHKEAKALIEKANILKPGDANIKDTMGWVEFRLKNYDLAETLLKQSLNSAFNPEILAHLIEVLWVKNKKDEARDWLKKIDQNKLEGKMKIKFNEVLTRLGMN